MYMKQKRTALLFLLAAIGILGFPVTAAFIGIDVFFTYVQSDQIASDNVIGALFYFY